jgi:tyrosine-protein kinase Etk/Wzc
MQGNNSINILRSQLIATDGNNQTKLSPREILKKYTAYLPWFLFSLALFVGIAVIYLRYKVPVYASSIKILVKDDSKKSGDDLSTEILSQLVLNGKSNLANEVEIVKSRTIMKKVVENLGINTLYYSKGRVHDLEIYDTSKSRFLIFSNIRDSSATYTAQIRVSKNKIFYITPNGEKEVSNDSKLISKNFDITVHIGDFSNYNPSYTYSATWYSDDSMAAIITDKLDAEPLNRDASIISLTYESTLPGKARDILNTLANAYTDANIQDKNEMIDNTIRFVDERLQIISGELGGVENKLQSFKENNPDLDSGRQQIALARTKDVLDQMDQLQVQLKVTEMVSQYVNHPSRKFSLVPSSLGIEDATLLDLIKSYNEGVINREELLKTLPEGNIAVSTVEDQLTQLQPKIVENINNIKQSYTSAYNLAKGKYDAITATMGTLPSGQKQLLDIERKQGVEESLFLYLLEKREESAINRASAVGNSSPIDPALTTSVPVEPKSLLIIIAAILLGFIIPLFLIYLTDLFNDKIITAEDILKYTKTPIIGEINHSRGKQNIIEYKSRNVLAEQFRMIRTNLRYFSLHEDKSNTIMITSSMSNEGKTFFSMNFGAALSVTGKKVVLVEFDLRKPKISSSLNVQDSNIGITAYLAGNTELGQHIIPIEGIDNYFLLAAGPIPPNPAELLLNPKMNELFSYLKKHFDYIIIDCPPIGLVSDPKVIAKYADLNFYIIRQRFTFKKQLKYINDLYEQEVLKNMVLLINDVVVSGRKGYYGYNQSYGYGSQNYSYNYGYGNSDKKSFFKKLFGNFD